MDKYEFNLKVDQIRKMVNKGDYGTAKKIADAIDWERVPNANLLSMISQVYEKNKEYGNAKAILLMAFERAPIGKRLLYKLTELALREESTEEAEDYYREFCDLAGDDPRQHLLRYMILKQRGAPAEQLIHSLESYTAEELDEKWLYELALLYHENGDVTRCVNTCDRLTLMFGLGKYVDKAIELKLKHAPLSKYQMDLVDNREKYVERLRIVERSFEEEEEEEEEYSPAPESDTAVNSALTLSSDSDLREDPETERSSGTLEPAPQEKEIPQISYEEDVLAAEVKQAETEAYLAEQMSQMEPNTYEEESDLGKTRILGDIRRSGAERRQPAAAEPEEKPVSQSYSESGSLQESESRAGRRAIHLMIEARTLEQGVDIAMEALRQVREFTGIKNPIAKISGAGLNKRGVLASAEKLAGKDLMVEDAGDMKAEIIGELERLISRDHTGMRVILIDNPKQIDMLEAKYPSLAEWFDFIREEDVVEVPVEMPPEAAGEYGMAENSSWDDPSTYEMPGNEMSMYLQAYPGYGSESQQPEESEYREDDDMQDEMSEYDREEPEQEVDDRPVRRVVPVRDLAMRAPDGQEMYNEEEAEDSDEEMNIDDFAQYACQYATDIDCSITGKSMLALYERIEIMEEDGLRLTKANAEALIEEAADRAEKPSLGKAIKGIFSSKYNKDGLLILKEEHFI